jgi:hypothetical protein
LPRRRLAPTFSVMRGGWRRFGLFIAAVVALVVLVSLATQGEERTLGLVLAQLGFISGMSYLVTFLVWPRRTRSPAHPSMRATRRTQVPDEPSPDLDPRPVLVIGNRPAGSQPASRVHVPESPTSRSARGRRPDDRQPTGEMRWPAQH